MKATVNEETCIGCGLCPSIAPGIFEMREDGKAHTLVEKVPEDEQSAAQEAEESCPVDAIKAE